MKGTDVGGDSIGEIIDLMKTWGFLENFMNIKLDLERMYMMHTFRFDFLQLSCILVFYKFLGL